MKAAIADILEAHGRIEGLINNATNRQQELMLHDRAPDFTNGRGMSPSPWERNHE